MQLTRTQRDQLPALARQYGLSFIVAFGSQITGATHPKSDLDLGYIAPKAPLSYQQEFELQQALQRLFPDQTVDLVDLGNAPALLKHRASFLSQLLTECLPHSFTLFQMASYLGYLETKPLRQLRKQLTIARGAA